MAAPYPNSAVDDDENGIEDSSRLFTTAARDLLGGAAKGLRSFFRYRRRIHFFALVGRNITTDAQTLDSIIGAHGLWKTTGGYLQPEPLIGTTFPTGFTGIAVGDWDFVASDIIAGNATATIPAASTSDGRLFEIVQILQTMDATGIATRTMTLAVQTAMPSIAAMGTADDDLAVTGPTITDTQEGRVFVPRAPGLVQLNDNGVITTTDISPLPILIGDGGAILSVITAGLAADNHRIAVLVRRIA